MLTYTYMRSFYAYISCHDDCCDCNSLQCSLSFSWLVSFRCLISLCFSAMSSDVIKRQDPTDDYELLQRVGSELKKLWRCVQGSACSVRTYSYNLCILNKFFPVFYRIVTFIRSVARVFVVQIHFSSNHGFFTADNLCKGFWIFRSGELSAVKVVKLEAGDNFAIIQREIMMIRDCVHQNIIACLRLPRQVRAPHFFEFYFDCGELEVCEMDSLNDWF